jgi:hypothetical protein
MLLRTPSALLVATALLTGCQLLIPDDGYEDTRSGFHDVTVTWHLKNLDGTVMSACPNGFSTLVAHMYVDGYVEPPDALVTVPCTAEGSLTQTLATAGKLPNPDPDIASQGGGFDYTAQKDIWLDITEETLTEYAARSYTFYVEKLDSDRTIDFDIYPAGGVGVAAWQLHAASTSAPIPSCATAGVDEIEAVARRVQDGDVPFTSAGKWPCTAVDSYFYYSPDGPGPWLDYEYELGSGHTVPRVPGDYEVELRALRGGAIVGKGIGYFEAVDENGARGIHSDPIVIDDR